MANPLFDTVFGQHQNSATPFIELIDGSVLTHDDYLKLSAQYANLFCELGLQPGDRVAVQIAKSPESLAVYAACAQSGMVFLPLNTAYTSNEVSYFVNDSGARLIICDTDRASEFEPMAIQCGAMLETMNAYGGGSFASKASTLSNSFRVIDRTEDDLAAFLYTSGTTGRSKGAMLTQANLLSNAKALVTEWRFTTEDTLLHALPIFHTHGLFVATNVALLAGSSLLFLPKFDLDAVIKLLPKATTMMGVPTFYTRLLDDQRFTKELAKHMRLFISGSAPLLAETHAQFEALTGHRILERYGMTETNMITSNPYDGERRAGTVGIALPGVEVKITDSKTGQNLPTGQIGDIQVRGPNVFKGYWQMPRKTAEELRADGFFVTGDLGQFDDDGYLQIVGRNKDLIISGGYNIYPKEVELLLDDADGVLESAVIGVPHPDFGETVVGVLVVDKHGSLDLEKICKNLEDSLAKFKRPQRLIVISELPRNTMGKVQKKVLREQYKGLFDSV